MEILYQDNRIVVAVKPCGVVSTDEKGGMPELLRQALNTECIRTVHRLDQPVGGVMVFARSRMAASLLSQQVREGEFQKEYLAVCHGTPAAPEGSFRDLLWRDRQTSRTLVVSAVGKDVQQAVLDYRVLASAENLSLVHVHLHTGRTHQIRVQFSSRGLPLLGDRRYGIADESPTIGLWSWKLSLLHPQSGQRMEFSCPPHGAPWEFWERMGCF